MTDVLVGPSGPQGEMDSIHGAHLELEGAEHLTYSGLFDRYASSPFGLHHAEQSPRYFNRYGYDPATMLDDLGPNIHPLQHMPYTEATIFRRLIAMQNAPGAGVMETFTTQEVVAGRLGALLHDIGECEHPEVEAVCSETVGDVNFWEKTNEDEKKEKVIRFFIYEALYGDVPAEIMEAAEDMVANPDGSFLGQAFAAAERVGYFLADFRAGHKAVDIMGDITSEADQLRFAQLRRMGFDEMPIWYKEMQARAERFPFIAHLVEQTTPSVERILTTLE